MQIHFQSITHFLCGRESQEQCCTCQPPCTVFAWKCFFSCNIFCNYYHDGSYLPQVGKMKRKFGPLPSQEVRLNPGQSRSDRHSYKSKVWPTFGLWPIVPYGSKDIVYNVFLPLREVQGRLRAGEATTRVSKRARVRAISLACAQRDQQGELT